MKSIKYFNTFLNESVSDNLIKPKTEKQLLYAVERTSRYIAVVFNKRKGWSIDHLYGPLSMTAFMRNEYGLSADGSSFFSSYSKESVIKNAFKCDDLYLMLKSKADKLFKVINKIDWMVSNLPATSYGGGTSPYRIFGTPAIRFICNGDEVHISYDSPRQMRHPNEYKHVYNPDGTPTEYYKDAIETLQQIEDEIGKIEDYARKNGIKPVVHSFNYF